MTLHTLAVDAFVEELGSNSPAPGGGSVAALAGAQAAALMAMVAELTVASKKYEPVHAEMARVAQELHALQAYFLEAIDRDANSFNGVMAAFRLPKDTEAEKAIRKETIQNEYKKAADVPFGVGMKALDLLPYAPLLLEKGNANAITDLGLGIHNLRLAVTGAFYNVKINLTSIKDPAYVAEKKARMAEALDQVETETAPLIQSVEAAID